MKRIFEGIVVEFNKYELYTLKSLALELITSKNYKDYSDETKEFIQKLKNL